MSRSSEVAAKIDAYLRCWEADPAINTKYGKPGQRISRYYMAGCYTHGGWVCIVYVSFHGTEKMRAADAEKYLAWIEAGNVGEHYLMNRVVTP